MIIRKLPLVGTSWYERGFVYWTRRAGIAVLLIMMAVAWLAMIEGALQAISTPGTPLYDGLAAAEIVLTIVTGIWVFRRSWHNAINGKASASRRASRAGRAGAGIGSIAFATGGLLAGLLVFCSLLTSGLVLAGFAIWILPTPPAEQYERREIAEEIRKHHMLQQLSPRSRHYGSKNHRKR